MSCQNFISAHTHRSFFAECALTLSFVIAIHAMRENSILHFDSKFGIRIIFPIMQIYLAQYIFFCLITYLWSYILSLFLKHVLRTSSIYEGDATDVESLDIFWIYFEDDFIWNTPGFDDVGQHWFVILLYRSELDFLVTVLNCGEVK